MKSGWEEKKLGEVCEILNGGTPDTKVSEYWDGQHLWITPKDMGKLSDIYVDETARTITDAGLKNSSAKIIPVNSIVLSSRAPIGHLAINTKKITTNQGCKGIVPKEGLLTLFLFYFLKNSVELLNSLGSGTTFKELSGSKLAEVKIPVPPLAEQKCVVTILDEAFDAIATANANAEKNLQNARELFDSAIESVFANSDNKWEEKDLAEIADIVNGYSFKSGDFTSGNAIKSVKITNVGVRRFVEEAGNLLPLSFASEYSKFSVKEGDIVIALTRSVIADGLKVAIVPNSYGNALLNQRVAAITARNQYTTNSYLYAFFARKLRNLMSSKKLLH